VKLLKIGWVGTRTENPEATADFFERVLGLRVSHGGDGVWVFQLPDGSKVEVFGPSENEHFTTGPVVEFLIDDVAAATQELRAAGVPIVSGPVYWEGEDDVAWVHFRAPDGNIYGITQGRDLESGP
jgi:catechol 2,3-dioxygenase-like lactoylglutathione lyase family enzyme